MESEFYYITVSTRPHPILDKLKQKVAENGESITVLGESDTRFIGWQGSVNFGVKLREVSNFIRQAELNDGDIVLFTDAYDVAYFGNKKEIIGRFLEFEKPIVFGCEKVCHPDPELSVKYTNTDFEFPYLNSGLFIGYVWALRKCFSDYVYEDSEHDQRYWTTQYLEKNNNLIELDYMNGIFLNTVEIDTTKLEVINGVARYNQRQPIFVHVNGPDKSLINELV